MTTDAVRVDVADTVATITLDRSERRNAWTLAMGGELSDALERCQRDATVRAVVLTGAGTAFSVGADMAGGDLRHPGEEHPGETPEPPVRCWPHTVDKPVIAALNGDAVGAGSSIAMLCDLRVIADSARMGFVFARRGVIAEMGSHWSLPRAVGAATAQDLLLTGRLVGADEAVRLGLCHQAEPATAVLATARNIAAEIAERVSPTSAAISKRLLWEDFAAVFEQRVARETALLEWCVDHGEATEGVESFLQRRAPRWQLSAPVDLPHHLL
ncbi:MAG TPA: enoyl-CoA hydratase-related protein [Mycobacteriales bacterium]|nr:enoyl-CoA hydratase-related protein [Mycobacteriales bacterium]